jgi:hypothetical protein
MAEHNALEHSTAILQGKVAVTAGITLKVGDFAHYLHIAQLWFVID